MHALKIILLAAAVLGLFVYLPPLFAANIANPIPLTACLLAVFFVGLVAGEALEFCTDRINLYRKL